jgi:hypothetical protein
MKSIPTDPYAVASTFTKNLLTGRLGIRDQSLALMQTANQYGLTSPQTLDIVKKVAWVEAPAYLAEQNFRGWYDGSGQMATQMGHGPLALPAFQLQNLSGSPLAPGGAGMPLQSIILGTAGCGTPNYYSPNLLSAGGQGLGLPGLLSLPTRSAGWGTGMSPLGSSGGIGLAQGIGTGYGGLGGMGGLGGVGAAGLGRIGGIGTGIGSVGGGAMGGIGAGLGVGTGVGGVGGAGIGGIGGTGSSRKKY